MSICERVYTKMTCRAVSPRLEGAVVAGLNGLDYRIDEQIALSGDRRDLLGTYWYPPRGAVTKVPFARVMLFLGVGGYRP